MFLVRGPMKTKKRQKLCYNCEGEVDLDVIVCPFCAADLRVEKPEMQRPAYDPTASLKNLTTQQSLYPPSYAPEVTEDKSEEEEPVESSEPFREPIHEEEDGEPKSIWGPTILMTLAAQLFLLGLLMLIFSKNGVLMLKWDARLWFLYILSSVPLAIFGYKSVSKL